MLVENDLTINAIRTHTACNFKGRRRGGQRACRVNINAEKTTTEELIIGGQMLLNQYGVVIGFNSIKLLFSNTT